MKTKRFALSLLIVLALSIGLYAGGKANTEEPKTDGDKALKTDKAKDKKKEKSKFLKEKVIVKALQNSVARVEYELKFDNGDSPYAQNLNCGVIEQQRPAMVSAYVIAPDKVITADPMIQSRFVESIHVCFGRQKVKAQIEAYAKDKQAVILKLAKPLKDAKPLKFAPRSKEPYFIGRYYFTEGEWILSARSYSTSPVINTDDSSQMLRTIPNTLGVICNKKGKPVTLCAKGQRFIPAKTKWKQAPEKWDIMPAEQLKAELGELSKFFDATVVRVALSFRSPRKDPTQRFRSMSVGGDDSEGTEKNVLGLVIAPNKVLVVALIDPKATARLERIRIYPNGKEIPAKFSLSLKNYGAFIATTDQPLKEVVEVNDEKITDFRRKLLLAAEPRLDGENLTIYYYHSRIGRFDLGWKSNIYPELEGYGLGRKLILFDSNGKLVAFPISRREPIGNESSRWSRDENKKLTSAAQVAKVVLAETIPDEEIDKANIPLSEEEENRLAWLGVALQPLNPELARMNKVSDKTNDGKFGAIVSYIYPDSPAAKAGIELGDIFLQIHVKDQPKPIKVKMQEYRFSKKPFPWAYLDQIPEQYFDQIPTPWVPAETSFTRSLTDLGFGKKFTLDYVRDGKEFTREFTVTQSPDHYYAAKRYKNKGLGLTVNNMTYEVRRYFQKAPKDPGVIISKIEPGSKASVGKLKPYEIITHVNDKPVNSAKEFEELAKNATGELKLAVTRMQKSRVVKLRMEDKKAPASQPASKPSAEAKPAKAPAATPAEKEEPAAPAEPAKAESEVKAKPEVKPQPKAEDEKPNGNGESGKPKAEKTKGM